ncbi:MAG: FHA domain-containing protein [Deltaproteobacteria bacterium]|nr:FHA domain-containing protein [Deltaproteobacteria bacterium]
MPLRLSFDSGPLAGIHIVTSAQSIRLGRDPGQNDILLTNPKVSRKHAVIERSVRGGYSLEVMGTGPSKINGDVIVAVAGRPVIQQLANGDRLDFGGIELGVAEAEVKFIVVQGPAVGRELAIDGPARIGSGSDCDLVIADPSVAPEHIIITSTPLGFRADAQAPTQFNGAQAESRVLSHGDELILGNCVVRFTVSAPDEDAPEGSLTNMNVVGRSADAQSSAVGELVFISGSAKGEKIPLGNDQIILGTRADCTLVLNDLLASPIHCAISKAGDVFVATDLGSEAGTYINGERIFQGTSLKPGDLIAIGSHVVESRLIGGVTIANKGNTIFTTLAPGGLDLGPQSKFVVDGRVMKAKKIVLGRAPSCDVIVDGAAVSREHCVIEWENGFICRDTSSAGTYIDDKRIVQQALQPTSVIRIVDTLFRVAVRGEVCTLERTDAVLAQAAVEVMRDNASMLTRGIQVSDAANIPDGASQFMTREGMKTIFSIDANQLNQQIAAKIKAKELRRGAPAWRGSSDLERNPVMRGTIVISVLAALALCGGALFFSGGKALVNHSLSPAHSSAAFTDQVSSKGGGVTVCGACHSAGASVKDDACTSCHDGFKTRPAKKSKKLKTAHDDKTCGDCHNEHITLSETDHTLGARAKCDGCHPNMHGAAFESMGPGAIEAGSIPEKPNFDFTLPAGAPRVEMLSSFHTAHARVKLKGKGPEVGIGCNACHSNGGEKGAALAQNKELAFVCFRCHDKPKPGEPVNCGSCHGTEHPKALIRTDASKDDQLSTPSPLASVGWAAGIAFAGIFPGLLFGLLVRSRRKRAQALLVEKLTSAPAEVVKRLVHSINDSKCVGCSMCVQACPASVLELVDHKSRVVNFDACIQCKRCEKACAFDALRMHDADKPPPMIPMPSVDAYHETPVQGMYLIGQASGTPQVKNATNLGRACIQRIVQAGFRPGGGRQVGAEYDVVIVGSGPAGLSAALTCVELGLSYVVLEKERELSWTIRNYYHKGKEVMAEPNDVGLEATLPHWDSTREDLLGSWEELVRQHNVPIKYLMNCVDVKKEGDRFTIICGDGKNPPTGTFTGARCIIAIGTLGNPRKVGAPGDDLEKVKNSLVDPDEWRGKSILVIGGSDSGVEVVMALGRPELGNKVYHSQRGAKLEGVKPKNLKLMQDALAAGKYEQRYATTIQEITPTHVALIHKDDGRREDLPNDAIFAMIGGNSPQKWLQQIGVPYVEKPHSWSPPRTDLLSLKTGEGLVPVGQQVQRLPRRPIPARVPHH